MLSTNSASQSSSWRLNIISSTNKLIQSDFMWLLMSLKRFLSSTLSSSWSRNCRVRSSRERAHLFGVISSFKQRNIDREIRWSSSPRGNNPRAWDRADSENGFVVTTNLWSRQLHRRDLAILAPPPVELLHKIIIPRYMPQSAADKLLTRGPDVLTINLPSLAMLTF